MSEPSPNAEEAVGAGESWIGRVKATARALFSTRLDKSGGRIRLIALAMVAAYFGIAVKLVALGVSHDPPQTLKVAADQAVSGARPDLLDRNGAILATDVKTMSVFADPRLILDKDEAVELITAVLPDVDAKELRERLASKKGFVWVKRQVTQKEQRGNLPPRTSRRRLPAREQARLSQRTARRARHRLRRQGQRRHRRDGEVPRPAKPHRSACRRLHRRSPTH